MKKIITLKNTHELAISSYNQVYSDSDDAPSMEDIKAERDRAEHEMKEIEFFIETWHD